MSKKALDLPGVQVHRQDAIHAGGADDVGHELGRDRHARLGLAVLAAVAEVGQHRRDPPGGGAPQRVHHQQQFHQIVVRRVARGLDDEAVRAAHVLLNLDLDFAVGKPAHVGLAHRRAEHIGDFLRQVRVRVPGENFERRRRAVTGFFDHGPVF
jgi:hypothetical protein